MHAHIYRDRFPDKAVFPVIHVFSLSQVTENLNTAADHGADGVFLIDHNRSSPHTLRRLIELIDGEGWFERFWIGANFLGMPNREAFKSARGTGLGGIWSDNAQVFDHLQSLTEEYRALYRGLDDDDPRETIFFGGVAFKGQPQPEDVAIEARKAMSYADVITTSGPQTGQPAAIDKLRDIREAIGDHPLAVASGITPENVTEQLAYVDAVLVATGISRDPYNLDPDRLKRLVDTVHSYQSPN